MHTEEIVYKQSRLKIITDKEEFVKIANAELLKQRQFLEEYIQKNNLFVLSLEPIEVEKNAPYIIKKMAEAGKIADVGPMAAVAGTIAEIIVRKMAESGAKTAVVNNGGDIYAATDEKIIIGLFSGTKLSGKIAFELDKENTPISICSSSSYLGHSLSFGKCDLATVFSKKGSIADAAATALCNSIKEEKDIDEALNRIIRLEGVSGALAIKNNKIGVIGDIPKMVKSNDKKIKEKIIKDNFFEF
jgi:ApbE superfamily uncharacterized protein (UPF0280 family)